MSVLHISNFHALIDCVLDEDEELIGEISGGLTDDEGIEDDHEESDSGSHQTGGKSEGRLTVGKSGTCDTLIALCRSVTFA